MNEAIAAYRSITVSKEFKEIERMLEDARYDEAQALFNAECKGEERGRAVGRAEGRAEGRADIVKNALRRQMPIADIMDLTGLTQAEVESYMAAP